MKPTLSLIIPHRNQPEKLRSTLMAMEPVGFDDVIVVDDGSDNKHAVMDVLRGVECSFLDRVHKGVPEAVNAGIKFSRSSHVMVGACGDEVTRNAVISVQNLPDNVIVGIGGFSDGQTSWSLGRSMGKEVQRFTAEEAIDMAKEGTLQYATSAVILSREAAMKFPWHPGLKWHADWFVFTHAIFTYGFTFVPLKFSQWIGEPKSYSSAEFDDQQQLPVLREMVRLSKEQGSLKDLLATDALACFGKRMVKVLEEDGIMVPISLRDKAANYDLKRNLRRRFPRLARLFIRRTSYHL